MKCKNCKRDFPLEDAIFCPYCGEKVKRTREKKKDIKVPKAKQQPSGNWFIWLAKEKVGVTEPTEATCTAKAKAIRAGMLTAEKKPEKKILKELCEDYVNKRSHVCSASTLRGYDQIINSRFKNYMNEDVRNIDWQKMINDEKLSGKSSKTIKNAFGFIACVLNENKIPFDKPTLPQVVAAELDWLDFDQIETFVSGMKNRKPELQIAALLCLHGLRRSEAFAVTPDDIRINKTTGKYEIHVEGATVMGRQNIMVNQKENKNTNSRRVVPIMIPRLEELIKESTVPHDQPYVDGNQNKLYVMINDVCEQNGLPQIGCHGLRRTFCSLGFHLGIQEETIMALGGWQDYKVMHDFYLKLSTKDKEKATNTMTEFYSNFETL